MLEPRAAADVRDILTPRMERLSSSHVFFTTELILFSMSVLNGPMRDDSALGGRSHRAALQGHSHDSLYSTEKPMNAYVKALPALTRISFSCH